MSNELFQLALAKKLSATKVKLEPGTYTLKGIALAEFSGTISKCEPEMYQPTAELPLKELIAVFVKKYGTTEKELQEMIVDAYTLALQTNESISEHLKYTERSMKRVEHTLGKLPTKVREGKTLVNGFAELKNISCEVK